MCVSLNKEYFNWFQILPGPVLTSSLPSCWWTGSIHGCCWIISIQLVSVRSTFLHRDCGPCW